jgi:hypothetical protein
VNLTLTAAFEKLGAKPCGRVRSASAIALDGALVLNCAHTLFGHPSRGVLRYEDKLSRGGTGVREAEQLRQHLILARDGGLPVRMVITTALTGVKGDRSSRTFHARPDLVGKVVQFDGDHFIVDFRRCEQASKTAPGRREPR